MMNENTTMTQAQVEGFGIDAKVPMVPQDVLDIDYAKHLHRIPNRNKRKLWSWLMPLMCGRLIML